VSWPLAVVTGGSRGIGAAVVEHLTQDGYEVVFTYVSAHAEAEAVTARTGADGVRVDLADSGAAKAFAAELEARRPGLLVNNAALAEGEAERVWQVCYRTPLLLTRAFAEAGALEAVVNVGSMNAVRGSGGGLDYTGAKAALVGLTRGLAAELAPAVRVNAVIPGIIDTAMNDRHRGEGFDDLIARGVPLGRLGRPDEVADAICWLLGASYVTGVELAVDGGALMRFPLVR